MRQALLCSSSIIDNLKKDPSQTIAYFYFDYSDPKKQDLRGLLSSLVFQLGMHHEECRDHLKQRCWTDSPTYDDLLSILSHVLRLSGPTVLIIDALDECPEDIRNISLLPFLESLRDMGGDQFRLLVTSRPESDISSRMPNFETHRLKFHDDKQHLQEICDYIDRQLASPNLYHWPSRVKHEVRWELARKANGMRVLDCYT